MLHICHSRIVIAGRSFAVALFVLFSASSPASQTCTVDGDTVELDFPCPAPGTVGEELARRRLAKIRDDARAVDCLRKFDGHPQIIASRYDGSVAEAARYLRGRLKDPDSFSAMRWSRLVRGCGTYRVTVTYRAKNSFGGYVIETSVVTIDASGRGISANPLR